MFKNYLHFKVDSANNGIVAYDRDRIKSIIENSFKLLYLNINSFMNTKKFIYVVQNSDSLHELFKQNFYIFNDLAFFVIKSLASNMKLNEIN